MELARRRVRRQPRGKDRPLYARRTVVRRVPRRRLRRGMVRGAAAHELCRQLRSRVSAAGELPPDVVEARRLLKAGQHGSAASLARARLLDTPKNGPPASRQVRKHCYLIAIEALFFGGKSGRLLRVFSDYM